MKDEVLALWELQHEKDIKLQERIRKRDKKMANTLEGKPYEDWLWPLGLFSLEETMRANLIVLFNNLTRGR